MAASNIKKSMTRFSIDDILKEPKVSEKKEVEEVNQTLISLEARKNYLRNVFDFETLDKQRSCYPDPPLLEESYTLKERRIYNELALKLDFPHSSRPYYTDYRASKPDLCNYGDCTVGYRHQSQQLTSIASQNNDFERGYRTSNNRPFPPSPTLPYFASQQHKCNGSCGEPPSAVLHNRRQSVEDRADLPYYYSARRRQFFPSPSSATKRHSYDFESSYSSSYSASPSSTISPTFGHSPSISPEKSPTDTSKMISDIGKNHSTLLDRDLF